MPHIINVIRNSSIYDGVELLKQTHSEIVSQVIAKKKSVDFNSLSWGVKMKKLEISLPMNKYLVGKESEKLSEIVNILATVERTISALIWSSEYFPKCTIKECHPSTSDNVDGNDIVLVNGDGKVIVRCEVTDIVSSNASQNGKEKKDLKTLCCSNDVPLDSVCRYIATSFEYSNALSSPSRKWSKMKYCYVRHETGFNDNTVLLEIRRKA